VFNTILGFTLFIQFRFWHDNTFFGVFNSPVTLWKKVKLNHPPLTLHPDNSVLLKRKKYWKKLMSITYESLPTSNRPAPPPGNPIFLQQAKSSPRQTHFPCFPHILCPLIPAFPLVH
jgi:hypothetical protein